MDLIKACKNNDLELVKKLINAGDDIHTNNDEALMNASFYGYTNKNQYNQIYIFENR